MDMRAHRTIRLPFWVNGLFKAPFIAFVFIASISVRDDLGKHSLSRELGSIAAEVFPR
jgi:hypothetical protein